MACDRAGNACGGSQLRAFIQTETPTRGQPKTCPGAMQDGDYWQITFDYAGADPSKIKYCTSTCAPDGLQFHMTAKTSAPLDSPYNPNTMNRYTQEGTGGKDLLQCSTKVRRQGDQGFTVYVYDNAGNEKGYRALSSFSNGGTVTVPGLPSTLTFTRIGPFATSGAGMSFKYNSVFPVNWFGDTKGSSPYGPGSPIGSGNWCTVTNTAPGAQDVLCYFPCPAA
ncbi:MAG: hypothetical protein Q9192_000560 [Flavoplaca navasiana]